MLDLTKRFITTIAIIVAGVLGLAVLDKWANDHRQTDCEQRGGEYFRAAIVENSLCRMPRQQSMNRSQKFRNE